ncbi:MAG: SCO family protein [Verrucomicrobiales bacterium]|nr:SCO family protein [Verrucomicrobiales bacterium]
MKPAFVLCALSVFLLVVGCDSSVPEREAAQTAEAAARNVLQPGDRVPDFAFTNHEGKESSLAALRPRAVLATFIFTRCTMAEFCPRMSAKFREMRNALDATARRDGVELLSITLDPEHDTPAELAIYAKALKATPGSWTFAQCQAPVLATLKQQFGVRAEPAAPDGSIEHNLITALITPDGRLRKIWEGNRWGSAEVIAELDAMEAAPVRTAANRTNR